ncbi:unnamed protein product [Oppiella nova]|uniref:WD repeat domain phosphoinositide-interacting protein 2 n=1 Tax=Oppiella nova TaxID=334625 RepID=A0A7R9M2L7_9ACAR|nr:unnamed protein product [Oppiella nova]CAG2169390.1 unnamed protein product [Oppiella nova]
MSENTGADDEPPADRQLFVAFNQDASGLTVGAGSGHRVYGWRSPDRLDLVDVNRSRGRVFIIERLFCSSLVAIVYESSPRLLRLYHFVKNVEISRHSYRNSIVGVRLNRQRLVVCLADTLYVHNIHDMNLLTTIRDTALNPRGLCVLSAHTDTNCALAYPAASDGPQSVVMIIDAQTLCQKALITAHEDSPLAAIAIDFLGDNIATASESGYEIRVFKTSDGQCVRAFRRGYPPLLSCLSIHSLAFSKDSHFLCLTSNTQTVHIFRLKDRDVDKPPDVEPQGWLQCMSSYGAQAVDQLASYWSSMADMMTSEWPSMAIATLPESCGPRSVCAVTDIQGMPRVMIASTAGYLYVYDLNAADGGECSLVKQHRIIDGL